MKIFSIENLSRNLKIFSIFNLVFSLFAGIGLLVNAVVLFALSIGVKRKEKWAAICGFSFFAICLINYFVTFFVDFNLEALLESFLGIIITILFLINFVTFLKENNLEKKISIFPFIIAVLSIIILLSGLIFIISTNIH